MDYRKILSIVGLIGEQGKGQIIEGRRYVRFPDRTYGNLAFLMDNEYRNKGISTQMFKMLIKFVLKKGIEGFEAVIVKPFRSISIPIRTSYPGERTGNGTL